MLTILNIRRVQQNFWKITKKHKNCQILGSKTPKSDILTLNYGLPSSFITLSTWRTTKQTLLSASNET